MDDRIRTGDRLDHNQELYQLSYIHRAAFQSSVVVRIGAWRRYRWRVAQRRGIGFFRPGTRPASAGGAQARGAIAIGALAVGAAAIGGFAIGRLGVGRLAIGRATIGKLRIGELEVERLNVSDDSAHAS